MRGLLLLGGFFAVCLGAMVWPSIGVLGYMANYLVCPEREWWGEALRSLGARQSLTLAAVTAIGISFRYGELRAWNHGSFWHSQELLLVAFTVLVVMSRVWGEPINMAARDLSQISELPAEKMPKVLIFVLMMTHVMVRYNDWKQLIWLFILVGGLYMGYDAWTASPGRFLHGRLDRLGGADFNEANMAAMHLAFVCALAGSTFMKSSGRIGKLLCFLAGGFAMNAIIMTQSRSVLIGMMTGGLLVPFLANRQHRLRLFICLAVGATGALFLTNDEFWARAETIKLNPEEKSAASRLDLAKAGLAMWQDYPLGVGAGSFYSVIGKYNPEYAGRDCHNTYVRCAAELGVVGIGLFAALIVNAFRTLRRVARLAIGTPIEQDVQWDCLGLTVGLVVYLVAAVFIGVNYAEEPWWLLCLPVCLERAVLYSRAASEAAARQASVDDHGEPFSGPQSRELLIA
jgi:putative inorganic carbon (HCO3(-)) transporter